MSTGFEYEPQLGQSRWLAYFDLLGTSDLIRNNSHFEVFDVYRRAIKEATRRSIESRISHTWFSDTFILYSESDSASDSSAIEQHSRWFFYFLTIAKIPARGAISSGEFYADSQNHIYHGKALLEAYEYGEAQNWIGFTLCPSAVERLKILDLPADERLNYAITKIPRKLYKKNLTDELPAYLVGEHVKNNGTNECIEKLKEMRNHCSSEAIAMKYENTIAFVQKNQRRIS